MFDENQVDRWKHSQVPTRTRFQCAHQPKSAVLERIVRNLFEVEDRPAAILCHCMISGSNGVNGGRLGVAVP